MQEQLAEKESELMIELAEQARKWEIALADEKSRRRRVERKLAALKAK